jgi:hypothetical protein
VRDLLVLDNLPLFVAIGKKKPKKWYLNLNNYERAHGKAINRVKHIFFHDIGWMLKAEGLYGKPLPYPVCMEYTLYPASKGRIDTNNVLSIVDKFLADALVDAGLLPDDHSGIITETIFRIGHVDKENPRARLIISEVG